MSIKQDSSNGACNANLWFAHESKQVRACAGMDATSSCTIGRAALPEGGVGMDHSHSGFAIWSLGENACQTWRCDSSVWHGRSWIHCRRNEPRRVMPRGYRATVGRTAR